MELKTLSIKSLIFKAHIKAREIVKIGLTTVIQRSESFYDLAEYYYFFLLNKCKVRYNSHKFLFQGYKKKHALAMTFLNMSFSKRINPHASDSIGCLKLCGGANASGKASIGALII